MQSPETLIESIKSKTDLSWADYANLAMAYEKQGRIQEAINTIDKAIKLNHSNADLHFDLGNLLRQNQNLPVAIKAYRNAIRLKPDHYKSFLQKPTH